MRQCNLNTKLDEVAGEVIGQVSPPEVSQQLSQHHFQWESHFYKNIINLDKKFYFGRTLCLCTTEFREIICAWTAGIRPSEQCLSFTVWASQNARGREREREREIERERGDLSGRNDDWLDDNKNDNWMLLDLDLSINTIYIRRLYTI